MNIKNFKKYGVFFASLLLFLPLWASASVICVDFQATNPTPDGSCWSDPYASLDEALGAARDDSDITAIWIADGTYKPSVTYAPISPTVGRGPVKGGAFALCSTNGGMPPNAIDSGHGSGGYVICRDANGDPTNTSQPGFDIFSNPIFYDSAIHDDKLKTFDLVDNVDLIGGFQGMSHPGGGETSKEERSSDISLHETILSGDLDGDTEADDIWHVLTAGNDLSLEGVNVTLDRLVVTKGNASAAPFLPLEFPIATAGLNPIYYHDDAGGLYIFTRSNVTLKDMRFVENEGVAGSAVFAHDGTQLSVEGSTFVDNLSIQGALTYRPNGPNDANGPAELRNTNVQISNSVFEANESVGRGAAIVTTLTRDVSSTTIAFSTSTISNSVISQNSAAFGAPAFLCLQAFGEHILVNNKIEQNSGSFGGGAIINRSCSMKLVNNTFMANTSNLIGGAYVSLGFGPISTDVKFDNNTFENNSAIQGGGAIGLIGLTHTELANNKFVGNFTDFVGGAIVSSFAPINTLINNTFDSNQAQFTGGAIGVDGPPSLLEKSENNTFINNVPNDIVFSQP